MITKEFAKELMKIVHEYGRAKQNLAHYSGQPGSKPSSMKEQDAVWADAKAAHTRVLKKIYGEVDFSLDA